MMSEAAINQTLGAEIVSMSCDRCVLSAAARFDVDAIRKDFPILERKVNGKPLVYLDNAASAQKPVQVLDAVRRFQERDYANVHRGQYELSERATEAYEGARDIVQRFIHAADRREIVFVRGATEAINLVASAYGRKFIGEGDEIVLSTIEHHANIVPWQMLRDETGARIVESPVDDNGDLLLDEFEARLTPRTKFAAITHVSNALGTINPIKRIVEIAHAHNVPILVDGAQAAPHMAIDVQEIGCDFYALSGHKMCAQTGIGALYGKAELLEAMNPYQGGGDMIRRVTFKKTIYNALPIKFEAGTPNFVGAVSLAAAIEYLQGIGMDVIEAREHDLLEYATEKLREIEGLRFIGSPKRKAAVISFVMQSAHPQDIAMILDQEGIALRTGHHCAQPAMDRFGVAATARASFAFYNTMAEADALAAGLRKVNELFA